MGWLLTLAFSIPLAIILVVGVCCVWVTGDRKRKNAEKELEIDVRDILHIRYNGFFLVEIRVAGPYRGAVHTLHGCVRWSPI